MRERVTRTAAFVRKEAFGVVGQPRLLATLVLGPFLVLLVFGLGLSDSLPRFSVVFVAPAGSSAGSTVDRYADELASYIEYRGVVSDEAEALARLVDHEVDVVAVLPEDPFASLARDRRAIIEVYHDALDPIQAAAIEAAARLAADEINRQILASIVTEGQSATQLLDDVLPPAEAGLAEARRRLEAGDQAGAEATIEQLEGVLELVSEDIGNTLVLLEETRGAGEDADSTPDAGALRRAIDRLSEPATEATIDARLAQIAVVERSLSEVRGELEILRGVRAEVLIRPFRAVTTGVGRDVTSALGFYAPAVIMLLVQHLGVTFSALSLVRERQLGTIELFAVAPVSSGEVLLGKLLGYLLLGGAVALLFVPGLQLIDVAFVGSSWALASGLLLVLLASLGVGFLISFVSTTDSQAVQLSMLSLLASFFFSGFFLPTDGLAGPAGAVGSLLPATHGITIAREVTLRGNALPVDEVGALLLVAGVTLAITWWGFNRQLRLA